MNGYYIDGRSSIFGAVFLGRQFGIILRIDKIKYYWILIYCNIIYTTSLAFPQSLTSFLSTGFIIICSYIMEGTSSKI